MPFDAGTSQRGRRSDVSDKSRTSNFNHKERSSGSFNRSDKSKSFNKSSKSGDSRSFDKQGAKVFRADAPAGERDKQRHFNKDSAPRSFGDRKRFGDDNSHSRSERNDRKAGGDRFDRGDRKADGHRSERNDRNDRSDRAERKDWGERKDRGFNERNNHSDRKATGERTDRNEWGDRKDRGFNDRADRGSNNRSERGFDGDKKQQRNTQSNERKEGRVETSDGKSVFVPRRKEIVSKQHPNQPGFSAFQLRLVQSILHSTLVDKKPLDKSYAMWFAKVKIPAVEQGFVIRHINAMFRRLSFYAHVADLKRPSDFSRNVERLILSYYATEGWPLPELNAEGLDRSRMKKRIEEAKAHPLYNEGCPFYLEELGSRELGEKWPAERKALGQAAPRFIRVNTLKGTRDELASILSKEGVVTKSVKGVHTALEVTSNTALFRTMAFREGKFEQQDAGSQLIAPFLEVGPGMRVIDACAGSGGKTLHLAALMNGKGSLIAMDIEGWKLDELKLRARRAGAYNIETRAIESTKVIKRLYDHADRVLIDAPCTGLGVIRRTADSKWVDIQPRLNELKNVQSDILERYSRMVKVGGKVVYSTCSILPSENELQVQAFLANHQGEFVLEDEVHVWPSSGFDGFYMARLRRVDPNAPAAAADAADSTAIDAAITAATPAAGDEASDSPAGDATDATVPAADAEAAVAESAIEEDTVASGDDAVATAQASLATAPSSDDSSASESDTTTDDSAQEPNGDAVDSAAQPNEGAEQSS